MQEPPSDDPSRLGSRRHFRMGWWFLAVFMTLGLVLETLHGFKVGWYLNVSNETRRLMWSLAHSHGTLFGLLHIAYALTLRQLPTAWIAWASNGLMLGTLLMPLGFWLGGWVIYAGDPGFGVFLAPLGALCLLPSTVAIARRM